MVDEAGLTAGAGAEEALEKRMKFRYAGACRLCGTALPARCDAIYERATKTVRCVECPTVHQDLVEVEVEAVVEQGDASPEMLVRLLAVSTNAARPRTRIASARSGDGLAGIAVALSDERQRTKAWERGAVGEERLGARLDSLASDDIAVLHDRCIPGSKANIDGAVALSHRVRPAQQIFLSAASRRVPNGAIRPSKTTQRDAERG